MAPSTRSGAKIQPTLFKKRFQKEDRWNKARGWRCYNPRRTPVPRATDRPTPWRFIRPAMQRSVPQERPPFNLPSKRAMPTRRLRIELLWRTHFRCWRADFRWWRLPQRTFPRELDSRRYNQKPPELTLATCRGEPRVLPSRNLPPWRKLPRCFPLQSFYRPLLLNAERFRLRNPSVPPCRLSLPTYSHTPFLLRSFYRTCLIPRYLQQQHRFPK